MRNRILLALLFLFAVSLGAAQAQTATVVAACGTPPLTYVAGQSYAITMDTTGKLCDQGSGGGTPANPSVVANGFSNAAGIALVPTVGGGAISSISPCSGPCNFYGGYVTIGATPGWIFIINAISLPANATLTVGTASGNLQDCIAMPSGPASASLNDKPGPPTRFSTGMTIAFSSTACPVLTASATATFMKGSAAQ